MDNKIRKLAEAKKAIQEQQFKHIRLCDLQDTVICSWSPANAKNGFEKKYKEIELRLKNLPAGVYIVQARQRFSGNEPIYNYYVGNKQYDPKTLDDALNNQPAPKNPGDERIPVPERQKEYTSKMLSVDKGFELVSENARLTAENESLRKELAAANKTITELEAELDENENGLKVAESPGERMLSMAEKLGTVLLPIADRAMDLYEKKINNDRSKLLHDAGYEIPEATRKTNGSSRTAAPEKLDFTKMIPKEDDPRFPEYLTFLAALDDDAFNTHLEQVKKISEPVYNRICEEFDVEFDNEP